MLKYGLMESDEQLEENVSTEVENTTESSVTEQPQQNTEQLVEVISVDEKKEDVSNIQQNGEDSTFAAAEFVDELIRKRARECKSSESLPQEQNDSAIDPKSESDAKENDTPEPDDIEKAQSIEETPASSEQTPDGEATSDISEENKIEKETDCETASNQSTIIQENSENDKQQTNNETDTNKTDTEPEHSNSSDKSSDTISNIAENEIDNNTGSKSSDNEIENNSEDSDKTAETIDISGSANSNAAETEPDIKVPGNTTPGKDPEDKELINIETVRPYSVKVRAEFWKSFFKDIVFLAVCIFFIITLFQKWVQSQQAVIIGTNQVTSNSSSSGQKSVIGNVNILVMGCDDVEGTHRSDTIFVLSLNPSKNKITMLSIPRDTRVIIEDKGRKINEVLPRYGEPTLRKIIEELLQINISRKMEVGFDSFISIINAIGGVDINIEKAMDYDDNWGNLHIHFKPGMNHLDGRQALNYVRFRKDAMADLGRIKRQQAFVKAVVMKLMNPVSIVKLPAIIENSFKYIDTDFTVSEIITIAKDFDDYSKIKFTTLSLPGDARYIDKISYFLPFSEKAIEIGNSYFSDLALFEMESTFDYSKSKARPDTRKQK